MTEKSMKDALPQYDGPQNIQQELAHLRELADARQRRAGRLKKWTIGVWIAAAAVMLPVVLVPGGGSLLPVNVLLVYAGIILLIVTLLTYRGATLAQVRASMASIDSQLRIIATQKK